MTTKNPGYVVYWNYPNYTKLRNTHAYQDKDAAVKMSEQLQSDGLIVNYISYRS